MLKSTLQNLALLGTVVLVCLIGAELFFRMWPQFLNEEAALRLHWRALSQSAGDQRPTIDDPHLGFLYRPNFTGRLSHRELDFTYTTDEKGFRNPSPWPEQADIVVVGDSMAFGYGVDDEQAWVRLVANELPEIEIVNLGTIGSGPEQYLRVLQDFGLDLNPKLVLFMLFLGNDLSDAMIFREWLDAGTGASYQEWRRTRGREPDRLRRLLEGSYLVAFLRGLRKSLTSPAAVRMIEWEDGRRVQLVPGLSNVENARPGDPIFELVMDTVDAARVVSNQAGSHFLALLMPDKEGVYLPLAPSLVETLRTALQERGIPFVDLTPHLRAQAGKSPPLFFEVDGHLNEEGERVIARLVTEHLRKEAQTYGLTVTNPENSRGAGWR